MRKPFAAAPLRSALPSAPPEQNPLRRAVEQDVTLPAHDDQNSATRTRRVMGLSLGPRAIGSLSLGVPAAFAGLALWLFLPWGGHRSGIDQASRIASPALVSEVSAAEWTGAVPQPLSLVVDSAPQVQSQSNLVTTLTVPITARGDHGFNLGPATRLRVETILADAATAAVPATFTVAWVDGNGDDILDPGEHAVLSVQLPPSSAVHPTNPWRLVLTASSGATLAIDNVRGP